jgi:Holliday junction resolvase-like predicted endonuclease
VSQFEKIDSTAQEGIKETFRALPPPHMSIQSPKRGPKPGENRSWTPQLTATLSKFSPELQQVLPWNRSLSGFTDKKPQGPQTKVLYMELMLQEQNGAVQLITTKEVSKGLYGIMEVKILDPTKFTGGYIKLPISKWCSNNVDYKKNARIWEVAQFFRKKNSELYYHYMHFDALTAIGIHRKKPTVRSRKASKLPSITSLLLASEGIETSASIVTSGLENVASTMVLASERLDNAASAASNMTQSLQNVASILLSASERLELKTHPRMTDPKMAIQTIVAKN